MTSMNRQTPRRSQSRPQMPYSPIQVLKSNTSARIQSNSRICRDQIANGTEIASPTIPAGCFVIRRVSIQRMWGRKLMEDRW